MKLKTFLIIFSLLNIFPSAKAQIIPDDTLPFKSIILQDHNSILIDGGSEAGTNLFHSFQEFSVNDGQTVLFNNASTIQNIFTRVTGNSLSQINGILAANGMANLFFLNPNGIIFGPNASLSIGGSFLGSTANSIKFSDGIIFDVSSSPNPVLSFTVPIELNFTTSPQPIQVIGNGCSSCPTNSPLFAPSQRANPATGLKIGLNRNLVLVGGDLLLDGAEISSLGGKIELASVAKGTVLLNPTDSFNLDYVLSPSFQDIEIDRRSTINSIGGEISLTARDIHIKNGSTILIQNTNLVPTNLISKGININSESLQLSGDNRQPFISNILTEAIDTRTSGTIKINTNYLKIEEGSAIGSRAYGAGNGSDVFISSQFTEITGVSLLDPSFVSGLIATTTDSGNAGNIWLNTGVLQISNGGFIVSTTFGRGQGGNVRVNATRVEIIGVNELTEIPSAIAANTISAGDAGNLIINTSQLAIQEGGRIDSSTLGSGNGGNILISAGETIEISGIDTKSNQRSSIFSTADFVEPVEQVFNLPASLSGNSGNIIVNTHHLNIKDGGVISVENQGIKDAGNINVAADRIVLDQGSISAETFSGEGGNINIQANSLFLQNSSKITSSAENQGNGGNININSDLLLAFENSEITANAFQGNGGNIEINGNVLIGSKSIISASSELGIDGQVQINGDIYEINDLTSKPTQFSEEQLIAQGCFDGQKESAIQIIKRGIGGQSLTGKISYSFIPFSDPEIAALAKKTASNPIVNAQRMVVMSDGTVHLLADGELAPGEKAQNFVCN